MTATGESRAAMPKRDVSPLGASRFERPYSPRSVHTSATNSPDTPIGSKSNLPFPKDLPRPNRGRPASVFSKETMETAPTSVASAHDYRKDSVESPVSVLSPDDWFAKFRCDEEPGLQSDQCPDRATLAAVQDIPLYDAEGQPRPFGSLYSPETATHQRQLLIFVRHFYCGACQAYLQAVTESISMPEYFSIPIPTSIIIIGCGEASMIPHYKTFTGCPFPMFADPTRTLFKKLGMTLSVNIGSERPEYMKDISPAAWAGGQVTTVRKSLKDPEGIRKRDILKGGNLFQIGGEFMFDDGQVVWCHRMKNYRNHTDTKLLRKILGLDD
ncbi:Hypothetical predicted protein [Lecanosticta acicola]|uniref:Uncharacterized protein n=1 Tax=Lecanosticta acicola TaxID=111012 RepID=A0AAI8Z8I5_9PEZI|nr:Hypothetical predicted protein [Lecanosticta acicola]